MEKADINLLMAASASQNNNQTTRTTTTTRTPTTMTGTATARITPPPPQSSTDSDSPLRMQTSKDEEASIVISALRDLQSSRSATPNIGQDLRRSSPSPSSDAEQYYDTSSVLDSELSRRARLIRKVRSHPIVNNAVRVYKSNRQYGVEMMEKATLPMVNILEQTSSQWKSRKRGSEDNEESEEYEEEGEGEDKEANLMQPSPELKKQKLPSISEALAISNRNLSDLNYRLSAESSKKITTCLQLLTLANNQIANKVTHLQNIIIKEQEKNMSLRHSTPIIDEAGDTFHDAQSTLPEITQIKTELITTMKKVVHFLSTHAGSSLPEPARSNVRESLLRLPVKLQKSSEIYTNANGKVLGLANESLEVVNGIIKVFNDTLGKAEGWVKEKQLQAANANNANNESSSSIGTRRRDNNGIIRSAIWNRMNLKEKDQRLQE